MSSRPALASIAVLRYAPRAAREVSIDRAARALRVSGLTIQQALRASGQAGVGAKRYTAAALRADLADGLLVERVERRVLPTEESEAAAASAERAARGTRPTLSTCATRSHRRRHPLSSLPICRPTQRCRHRGVGSGWHCVTHAARSADAASERAAIAAGTLSEHLCERMSLP